MHNFNLVISRKNILILNNEGPITEKSFLGVFVIQQITRLIELILVVTARACKEILM